MLLLGGAGSWGGGACSGPIGGPMGKAGSWQRAARSLERFKCGHDTQPTPRAMANCMWSAASMAKARCWCWELMIIHPCRVSTAIRTFFRSLITAMSALTRRLPPGRSAPLHPSAKGGGDTIRKPQGRPNCACVCLRMSGMRYAALDAEICPPTCLVSQVSCCIARRQPIGTFGEHTTCSSCREARQGTPSREAATALVRV